MNILVFDIETIPDIEGGRRIYGLREGLTESEIHKEMIRIRQEKTTNNMGDFLPPYLQKIIAISVLLKKDNTVKIGSLGHLNSNEYELLEKFFQCIEKYVPILISWNGGGFDLPVLHHRALFSGIRAPTYWNIGEERSDFRWNNYLNRFHYRHMDLMDILAAYQIRASAPLAEVALMLGLPGKIGMTGQDVWGYFQKGRIEEIRHYCETDVLNTYLIYLRFEYMRGKLNKEQYREDCECFKKVLEKSDKNHFNEFLKAWPFSRFNNFLF